MKSHIMKILFRIDAEQTLQNKVSSTLLKALLWHYLFQLEVDGAFKKTDSLVKVTKHLNKDVPEAAWLEGVHLIRASKIVDGFRVLDSLRTGFLIDSPDFLFDLKELSLLCFLPVRYMGSDTVFYLQDTDKGGWHPTLSEQELVTEQSGWRMVEQMSKKNDISLFVFGTVYKFKPPFTLRFYNKFKPNLKINIDNQFLYWVWDPLLFQFDKPLCDAEVEIIADNSLINQSQADYLKTVIGNKYDEVRVEDVRSSFKGISIRCYRYSIYRDIPGEFNAVFDLKLKRCSNNLFYCTDTSGKIREYTVRYTVSVKSSIEVEDKAEFVFKNVLNQFINWQ